MERESVIEQKHPDRRGLLVFFGVFCIAIGALDLFLVLVLLAASVMRSMPPATATGQFMPSVLMFLGLATLFIWLGVGSILCRRWARALLLVFSVTWSFFALLLVAGIALACTRPDAFAGTLLPEMFAGLQPAGMTSDDPAVLGLIIFCTLVTLAPPITFFCFYRLPSVKATCERRNPQPSWTDRSPLPVLTMSKLLLLLALSMLFTMPTLSFGAPEAAGGGAGSALLGVIMALIFAVLAVEVFRLKRWALISSAALVLAMQAAVMILMARSPASVMGAAGDLAVDPVMLERAQGVNIVLTVVFSVAWLAYCAWLWRFFPGKPDTIR